MQSACINYDEICLCIVYRVCVESWVVTCRGHDPSMHKTSVGQHVVSPALCHTLEPLGRSSRPRTASRKHKLTVIRQFNTSLPQSVGFSCWDWDGWPGIRNCPSLCKPLILLKCQQAKHWNLTGSRKAAVQQIWPPCGYEQAKKEFPYGINKAPHYCSAYSFICLLIKCVCLPPTSPPSYSHLQIQSCFPAVSQISSIKATTTSRFTWFDWGGHAQSILEEVCEKLSDITLALTKRCECPDRGNDTGHIKLNDNQRGSSPLLPA